MKWITRRAPVVCVSICLAAAAFAQPALPRAADEFRIIDSSGKTLTVSECRGKVVVMQFLYTTCSHCQATARMLSTLEREFAPRGLQVIGVAFNPEAQHAGVIDDFVKANGIAFPVGSATPDVALAYLKLPVMERFVVPQILVIDRGGMIRAQSSGQGTAELQDETYMRSLLDGLLKKDAAKPSTRLRR
jgi:peroxiredoxin